MNFAADFGPFEERTWINCAHQGALPRVAANEAREAVKWKSAPHQLTDERFSNVPHRLKKALGSLIGASANDIILGNSASYGLHLDRKSTRLNSSHVSISYAVFCLKKKRYKEI